VTTTAAEAKREEEEDDAATRRRRSKGGKPDAFPRGAIERVLAGRATTTSWRDCGGVVFFSLREEHVSKKKGGDQRETRGRFLREEERACSRTRERGGGQSKRQGLRGTLSKRAVEAASG
jgi:hypothetical protein